MNPRTVALSLWIASLAPLSASADDVICVPDSAQHGGEYRCFNHHPRPSRARATVRAVVEGARYLSGGALPASWRDTLEDHFHSVAQGLGDDLPSLVDARGTLHTPDVRLSVVMLSSGSVGRVRVLNRLADPVERRIAQVISEGVSSHDGVSVDGSEVEVIVRFRPQLRYTHYRVPVEDCCDDE